MTEPTLDAAAIRDAGLDDWRLLQGILQARFRTDGYPVARALANAIAAAAEAADHHPELTLAYDRVDVRLWSHDANGVTERDVALARTISVLARAGGITADADSLGRLELCLDTDDPGAAATFWAAFLGADADEDGVRDPDDELPPVWFQRRDPDAPGPQRWHLDLWVPADQVERRIAAVLAAGGSLVDSSGAPSYWVLADAEGNRSCLCTSPL